MTAPPGGGVTYHIRHSPVLAIDMITCVGEASTSEAVDTSILLTGLDPRVFYSVMVDAIIQHALPMVTGPSKIVYMCILLSYAFVMQSLGTIEVIVIRIHGCLCAGYTYICHVYMCFYTRVVLYSILATYLAYCLPACTQLQIMLLWALALSLAE